MLLMLTEKAVSDNLLYLADSTLRVLMSVYTSRDLTDKEVFITAITLSLIMLADSLVMFVELLMC